MSEKQLSPAARLARVFVDHSLKIKKGDKVVISSSDLMPLELLQETYAYSLSKGAYVYLDIMGFNLLLDRSSFGDFPKIFYENANEDQITNIPSIYNNIAEWGDKFIRITSLDNPKHLSKVDSKLLQKRQSSYMDIFEKIIAKDWVLTYYPTPGMAQAAGMSMRELEDFYYNSVLVDYEAMQNNLKKLEAIIDNGKNVRLIGQKTDLTFSIEGRTGQPCFGERNIPDGEVFTAPVEDSVNGKVYFEFPGLYSGKEINGIELEFKDGKVINYSSETNQDALEAILNTDEGAKTLGEFAIGANFGIKDFMFNTLFDEKIGGTIHMALGKAYTDEKGWGKNKSAIHWDIVKDMRLPGSKLLIDDKEVLVEGELKI